MVYFSLGSRACPLSALSAPPISPNIGCQGVKSKKKLENKRISGSNKAKILRFRSWISCGFDKVGVLKPAQAYPTPNLVCNFSTCMGPTAHLQTPRSDSCQTQSRESHSALTISRASSEMAFSRSGQRKNKRAWSIWWSQTVRKCNKGDLVRAVIPCTKYDTIQESK
jgi:hypothetical protein